jgi:hypothetical protein
MRAGAVTGGTIWERERMRRFRRALEEVGQVRRQSYRRVTQAPNVVRTRKGNTSFPAANGEGL